MTDVQKSQFCDNYCKYADESNKYILAARNCASGDTLQRLIDYSQGRLYEYCEKCILNRIGDKKED